MYAHKRNLKRSDPSAPGVGAVGVCAAGTIALVLWLSVSAFAQSAPLPKAAGPTVKSDITIADGWTRATTGNTAALYFRVVNVAKQPDQLIGLETEMSEKIELREKAAGAPSGGVVQAVAIPAAGEARFEPGGNQVMLVGLRAPLHEGESFIVTYVFAKAGKVSDTIRVGAPNATGPEPIKAAVFKPAE